MPDEEIIAPPSLEQPDGKVEPTLFPEPIIIRQTKRWGVGAMGEKAIRRLWGAAEKWAVMPRRL